MFPFKILSTENNIKGKVQGAKKSLLLLSLKK